MMKVEGLGVLKMQLYLCTQMALSVRAAASIASIPCTATLAR